VIALPEVEGVGHRTVEARGLSFHLAEAGGGDDVILCLHGWPQHWFMWRDLMPRLAGRHRVLALDLRGFGWSDAPSGGYEKENMATDVAAVLDALGLERVKLIGHDWGGWIGFLLALREPERIERFLALGAAPPWPSARSTLPHAWRFAYQLPIVAPWLGQALHRRGTLVPKVLVGGSTVRDPWDEATIRAFSEPFQEPARARAAVSLYRAFALCEAPALLAGRYEDDRLTVPTRLVNGRDDFALSPALLSGYERHADDLEVELVEGCGHFIVDEMPSLVADRAEGFLSG
jgi:pimeloyl-ACP methyl ester carboxylesterase